MSSTMPTKRSYRVASGGLGGELRVDQEEGDPGRPRRRDPAFDRRTERRLVDPGQRVVGADLPDHELGPAGLQGGLEALQRGCGHLAADARVPYGRGRLLTRQLVREDCWVGVSRGARADPLGGRRANGENVEDAIGAALQIGEPDAGRLERRRLGGTFVRPHGQARKRGETRDRSCEKGQATPKRTAADRGGTGLFRHSIERARAKRAATPAIVYASPAVCSIPWDE